MLESQIRKLSFKASLVNGSDRTRTLLLTVIPIIQRLFNLFKCQRLWRIPLKPTVLFSFQKLSICGPRANITQPSNRLPSPHPQHVPKFMPRIFNLQNNHSSTWYWLTKILKKVIFVALITTVCVLNLNSYYNYNYKSTSTCLQRFPPLSHNG